MDSIAAKRLTAVWAATVIAVFLVLVALGLMMRLNQAGGLDLSPDRFYAIMTLHGLGMAGTLFVGGLAALWYLATKYARPSAAVMWIVYVLVLLGTVGLILATLVGRFGAGWYVLYPLPFIQFWPQWSTGLAIVSLIVLGVAWLLGQLELLRALIARYGFANVLAWQYFRSGSPATEVPPFVLITVVSLIAGALTTVAGAVLLMLYLAKWIEPSLQYDALLMKNIVFLFGHTLVNITMYFGLAVVYDLMPEFSGRPWKTNRVVALSWNLTLLLVLLAFFHHLYMDFAQPVGLQIVGQIASYLSAIPATVVTIFGAFGQVYRSGMKWRFVPLGFYLGLVGWVIGGLAAVIDSTIMVNVQLHNTLWVPAHFHTYFLVGFVFILLGFIYYLFGSDSERGAKLGLWTMAVGGYGFLTMFYLGGVLGVPRRYATYSAIPMNSVAQSGQTTAAVAAAFVVVLVAGLLIYAWAALRHWGRVWASPRKA